jgi:hypothetical protein
MDIKKNKESDIKKCFLNIVVNGSITKIVVTNKWAISRLVKIKDL